MREFEQLNLRQWHYEQTGLHNNLLDYNLLSNKLQWLKIYDCNDEKKQFSDRVYAKSYVKEKCGDSFVIPDIAIWENSADVYFEKLPNEFVMKAAHGVEELHVKKASISSAELKNIVETWLNTNYAYSIKQYELEKVSRKIICEKELYSKMKIECWLFYGELQFIVATDNLERGQIYNREWKTINGNPYDGMILKKITKPLCLDKLLITIGKISHKKQPFERIDFIIDNEDNLFFDGYYYAPKNGYCTWNKKEQNKMFGSKLKLPTKITKRENKEIKILDLKQKKEKGSLIVEYNISIDEKKYILSYKIKGDLTEEISQIDVVDSAVLTLLTAGVRNGYRIVSNIDISWDIYYVIEFITTRMCEIDGSNAYWIDICAQKKEKEYNNATWKIAEKLDSKEENSTIFQVFKDKKRDKPFELSVETNIGEIVENAFELRGHELNYWLNRISAALLFRSNVKECIINSDEQEASYNWNSTDIKKYSVNWLLYSFSIGGISFKKKEDNNKPVLFDITSQRAKSKYYRLMQAKTSKLWKKDFYYYIDSTYKNIFWIRDDKKYKKTVSKIYGKDKISRMRKKILRIKFCIVRKMYGCRSRDFFFKMCYNKNIFFCNKIVTTVRMHWINRFINDENYLALLDDKRIFAIKWEKFFKRKWCDESASQEEFERIFAGVKNIIVKPNDAHGGKGIMVYNSNEYASYAGLYKKIHLDYDNSFILEEFVTQTGFMHNLNESTMNTIRIITIRNPYTGEVRVVNSFIRVGMPEAMVDNYANGGVTYTVDSKTGTIGKGMSKASNGEEWEYHPGVDKRYTGLVIPKWESVKNLCAEAHTIAPNGLNLIGWDVCMNENDFLLVEGNAKPGFGRLYTRKENQWKPIMKFAESFIERK